MEQNLSAFQISSYGGGGGERERTIDGSGDDVEINNLVLKISVLKGRVSALSALVEELAMRPQMDYTDLALPEFSLYYDVVVQGRAVEGKPRWSPGTPIETTATYKLKLEGTDIEGIVTVTTPVNAWARRERQYFLKTVSGFTISSGIETSYAPDPAAPYDTYTNSYEITGTATLTVTYHYELTEDELRYDWIRTNETSTRTWNTITTPNGETFTSPGQYQNDPVTITTATITDLEPTTYYTTTRTTTSPP